MKPLNGNSHTFLAVGPALAFVLTSSLHAATPLDGDHNVVPFGGELGSLTVAGHLETAGNGSVFGSFDFGVAAGNSSWAGGTLLYAAGTEKTAKLDLSDSSGSFLWRDNLGVAARDKMKLDGSNQLSLYNAAGTTATIVLNGGNGQLNLTGTGSGIYANGTSVFTVGGTGNITWDRVLGVSNTTASTSSTTGALTVAGGIGVAKDSYINSLRIGMGAGNINTNSVVGAETLNSNTSGYRNSALGYQTLNANTTGYQNVAVGYQTLKLNTTGANNTAVGASTLAVNTTGRANTAIGAVVMTDNTTGMFNTGVGNGSLFNNTTGNYNTGIGVFSLGLNTTGSYNTASGYYAGYSITTGVENTLAGNSALRLTTTGNYNVAIGSEALHENISGGSNIALGKAAGRYQANGTSTLTSPENSIYIGAGARGLSDSDDNSIVIGYTAIGEGANTTVIGNSATVTTHLYGQTNANSLKVNGATDLNNQVVVEPAVAPETAVRAMRVLADGTILIRPGGDLSMEGFTGGEQP